MSLTGLPGGFSYVEVVQTSAEYDLEQVFSGEPADDYPFPGRSITTLIFSKP